MNISEILHDTTQPYSSLPRQIKSGDWLISGRTLDFNMQSQTESNWCWAANATSVSLFYWSWSGWTQCKVACSVVNLTTCCDSPVPDACNQPETLSSALTVTKNLSSFVSSTVSFDTVKAEIDAGRVVCARIGWSGGGGHFVTIRGYVTIFGDLDFFEVDDPIYGKSTVTVTSFTTSYQTTGSWTHTYFTKSYIHMPFIPILIAEEVLERIQKQRVVLGMQEGLPVEEIAAAKGRTLGLAHAIFTLGLDDLARGDARRRRRVCACWNSRREAGAFYDVPDAETAEVRADVRERGLPGTFSASAVGSESGRQVACELRLLQAPALNFEALWLHFGRWRGGHGDSAARLPRLRADAADPVSRGSWRNSPRGAIGEPAGTTRKALELLARRGTFTNFTQSSPHNESRPTFPSLPPPSLSFRNPTPHIYAPQKTCLLETRRAENRGRRSTPPSSRTARTLFVLSKMNGQRRRRRFPRRKCLSPGRINRAALCRWKCRTRRSMR